MSHSPNPRTRQEADGWWFSYTTLDGDYTEDGPFISEEECQAALDMEMEDLFIEAEGDLI
jgi:hypothetical protein